MPNPIGIDLGTTNSVVCVRRRGGIETIPLDGRTTLPSVVAFRPDGTVLVGNAARSRAMLEPGQAIASAKRFIGDGETEWRIGDKRYSSVDVSAFILGRLKEAASAFLGEAVREAVITVPAYFNNSQKQSTLKAGALAGLDVLQLLPEPTAAAIAYGLDKGRDQTLLVYDLGGGTFDISVLRIKGNEFQVVAVDGDFHLGGDDFDLALAEHLLGLIGKRTKANPSVLLSLLRTAQGSDAPQEMLLARQRLKEAAEKAKIELSENDTALVTIPDILGTSLDEEITLAEYNRLISPFVDRTLTKMRDVLRAAQCGAADIDRVILVGGSTRNRLVRERVANAVKEPWVSDRVDEVVAQGAAIVASQLYTPEEDSIPIEVQNVTPFSLGVCALDGENQSSYVNSIILRKNSPVPCSEEKPYQLWTTSTAPNELDAYVLQGESEDVAGCMVVGKYTFSGIAHSEGKAVAINIRYGYDRNGIITVQATEKVTGRALPCAMEPLPGDMSWLQKLRAGPYTRHAGRQRIPEAVTDLHGNAMGNQYDLAEDNAFAGQIIAVLQLYTEGDFDFDLPTTALAEKGFKVHRWTRPPGIGELISVLETACQIWIISDRVQHLTQAHYDVIQGYFESGRGLYLWGDNDPYFADINPLSQSLFYTSLSGNTPGDQIVTARDASSPTGFESHLLTTGIEHLYEGVTVGAFKGQSVLQPLVYGSNGHPLIGIFDRDGRRAILDGGFTRLYNKWDTAGTGRYVKNAASWLVNYEKFGISKLT